MTNPQDQEIEKILLVGFLYGIQSDLLPKDELVHRVAAFKHTKGYREAKQYLNNLITKQKIEAAWHLHRSNGTKNKRDFDTDTDEYICQEYIPRLENLLKENKNE